MAARSTTYPAGTSIGPFQIVGVLGRGGMATVYEAYEGHLDRAVALKVLPPEFLHDGTFARRFEKEARVVAKLEHPNIVPIYASGIDQGIPWMSMRLFTGGNLGELLERNYPSPDRAVQILRAVADALDYAHARGVVHRDIKPTNILLDGAGGVCVGDFGLAHMLDGSPGLTRSGTLIGTPQYMAPEQVLGQAVDASSDIYSLGIVAYELFSGALPFTGESPVAVLMKHVHEPLPVPAGGQLPPPLMHTIRKAAAKSPADRWPSAGDFAAALEQTAGPAPLRPAAHGIRPVVRTSRSPVAWAGATAAILLAVAGFALFAGREPSLPPGSELAAGTPAQSSAAEQPSNVSLEIDPQPVVVVAAPERIAPRAPRAPQASPPLQPTLSPMASPPPPIQESAPPIASAPAALTPRSGLDVEEPRSAPLSTPGAGLAGATDAASAAAVAVPPASVPEVVTLPARVRTVSADYPAAARAAELEGDVVLQAIVEPDGSVSNVAVLQGVHPVLDDAARKAVLLYQYTPGRRNGVAESMTVRVTVSFRLR